MGQDVRNLSGRVGSGQNLAGRARSDLKLKNLTSRIGLGGVQNFTGLSRKKHERGSTILEGDGLSTVRGGDSGMGLVRQRGGERTQNWVDQTVILYVDGMTMTGRNTAHCQMANRIVLIFVCYQVYTWHGL